MNKMIDLLKKISSIFLVAVLLVSFFNFAIIDIAAKTVSPNDYASVLQLVRNGTNETYYQKIYKLVYGGNNAYLASTGEKTGYKDMYVGQTFTDSCPGNGLYFKDMNTNKEYCTGGWQCFAYARYAFYNIFETLDGKNVATKVDISTDSKFREAISSYAKPGCILRVNSSDGLNGSQHSTVYIATDSSGNGFYALEAGHYSSNSIENVRIGYYSWSLWRSNYGNKLSYIYMPLNYKDPDPKPVDLGDKFYANIYNPESQCQLTNSNNNVNLKSATNDANQLWYFERDSDLGYKITSFVDGTCLDAENGEYSNGTNVQTYDSNSSDAQRWYFIDIGMDHYSIRTKLGKAYVDAHTTDGVIEPGANVQLYSLQDSDAQVYCVNKVDSVNSFLAHNVGTDFYANIFNTSTDYLLTNTDNNVTLDSEKSSGTDASQIWKFERQSNGCYVIRSASNNRCLDAEMGKVEDGTNLQIFEDNETDAQKWVLCNTGNHSYLIKSAVGNAVADAKTSAGEIYDGTSIQLYHPNGTEAQAYDIRVIDNISDIFAEDIGTDYKGYIINPSTGYRLTNNNSNVTLDSETEDQNQIWRFERQEDNSYIIRSAVDSTCIDAEMGETEDGTNVQIFEYNGTEAQRWYFYKKGNNQYTIVCSKADVVIDAKTSAGEISDGTNIQLYHPNGTDAQIYSIQMIDDEQKILGDADCDDEVTILDATVIQRHLVEIPVKTFDEVAADCDGDEVVTIIDATWIQRHLVQMAVPYSIGEPINEEVII